ncbi:MAG: glucan biosynthesis protein [Alphaproteobacteria bacterium]|nr:glucan biosynthesis protein [Alphaproteobacteria bacterium]
MGTRAYDPPRAPLPKNLAELGYDGYRGIRFRPDAALWRTGPFEAEFFHRGFLFRTPVAMNEVVDDKATPILFDPSLFTYSEAAFSEGVTPDLGFAGMRLHAPLNRPDVYDEAISFLGASYFRALGRGNVYGLSARGLLVNAATQRGEEFPIFREFWLERPANDSEVATIFALLDSDSVVGAYRFKVEPGMTTVVTVESRLFVRKGIEKLGIAPLTGMFVFGENDRAALADYRPEVHDCDGLAVWTGAGEHVWRPLENPDTLRVSSFLDRRPRGFGLLQRDRAFESYQDTEARYERRPSAWVEPLGDWGEGAVQLLELPTPTEFNDNISAYWVPREEIAAGRELAYRYRLHWGDASPAEPDAGLTVATRTGHAGISGSLPKAGERKFAVDFAGGQLAAVPADTPLEAAVTASGAELSAIICVKLPDNKTWRALFDATRQTGNAIELRCFLHLAGRALTETWSYQWTE